MIEDGWVQSILAVVGHPVIQNLTLFVSLEVQDCGLRSALRDELGSYSWNKEVQIA